MMQRAKNGFKNKKLCYSVYEKVFMKLNFLLKYKKTAAISRSKRLSDRATARYQMKLVTSE
jgi:hypothetical protein